MAELTEVRLLIVYDNNEFDPKLKTGLGFGCIIETGDKTVLFDTGGDGPTLLGNIDDLGIDPKKIDIIFLSHIHGDHTGGLSDFLEKNNKVKVFLLKSFPSSFKEEIKSKGAEVIEVTKGKEISEGFYSTGELGTRIKEQSLAINTNKGLIVMTGCAHPGIVNIIEKAKELLNKKIYLVLGGFHLLGASDVELGKIIDSFRRLGVENIGPCHCSGDRCRELFKEEYKNAFIEVGVGKVIDIGVGKEGGEFLGIGATAESYVK